MTAESATVGGGGTTNKATVIASGAKQSTLRLFH